MRIVLDSNVLISGVFFSGPPYTILKAWRDGEIQRVVSPEIFQEYQRVAEELSDKFPGIDISDVLNLLLARAEMVNAEPLPRQVCADADDDKFIACAAAGSSRLIVSGDKHLLDISPYQKITVIRPRQFVDKYLLSRTHDNE